VYDTIAQILQARIGLMPDSIGQRTLNRAIDHCMAAQQLSDPQDYLQRLQSTEALLQELIETVIVPETWFMRDRAPFDFLKSQVQLTRLASDRATSDRLLSDQRPLRILSLPCSTGEEPYSIAMTLLEAGLNPTEFSVDGIDISHGSLGRARIARYGDYAFRNQTPEIRDRYFTPDGKVYQLQKQVCDRVTFIQGNILERTWINPLRPYHVIFCRNLLIYLTQDSRRRVFAHLETALAADGILFLGSTESTQPVPLPLKAIRHQGTLLYHKQTHKRELTDRSIGLSPRFKPTNQPLTTPRTTPPIPAPSTGRLNPLSSDSSRPQATAFSSKIPAQIPAQIPAPAPTPQPPTHSELSGLRRLADAGLLDEAIESCEYYLRGHSSDAEGHLLLGELYQAQQLDSRAEECYRRATYLNPDHRQALVHLALLKEQQGDNNGANLFWRRVDRLEQRSP
jgi:chemotaxis protein methyltransferase WspC